MEEAIGEKFWDEKEGRIGKIFNVKVSFVLSENKTIFYLLITDRAIYETWRGCDGFTIKIPTWAYRRNNIQSSNKKEQ